MRAARVFSNHCARRLVARVLRKACIYSLEWLERDGFIAKSLAKSDGVFNSRRMSSAATRTSRRKRNRTGSFELRESPGYLLRRCHQRSRQIFDELIGDETGLSRQQLAVLIGIDRNPNATQAKLSEATGFDRNTLAELMNRLIGKKLVERRRAESDARAYKVTLSDLGATIVRNSYPKFRQVQARILAPLPVRLRPQFLQCLHILADSLGTEEHKGANGPRHGKPTRPAASRRAAQR